MHSRLRWFEFGALFRTAVSSGLPGRPCCLQSRLAEKGPHGKQAWLVRVVRIQFLENAKNYEKKLKLFGNSPIIPSNADDV
jgi:hypothetical protein